MEPEHRTKSDSSWWRWPENRNTGRVAWFVILRRLACYPLMVTGLLIYVAAVALGWGAKNARRAWRGMQ